MIPINKPFIEVSFSANYPCFNWIETGGSIPYCTIPENFTQIMILNEVRDSEENDYMSKFNLCHRTLKIERAKHWNSIVTQSEFKRIALNWHSNIDELCVSRHVHQAVNIRLKVELFWKSNDNRKSKMLIKNSQMFIMTAISFFPRC